MKAICRAAALRRARSFRTTCGTCSRGRSTASRGDVAKLADVLGHSSIETTRIYLISTARSICASWDACS